MHRDYGINSFFPFFKNIKSAVVAHNKAILPIALYFYFRSSYTVGAVVNNMMAVLHATNLLLD